MIKLRIINKNNLLYTLLDIEGNEYDKHIEFIGDKIPQMGDYIYLTKRILNEINIFCYGPLNSIYSKKDNVNKHELMKVVTKDGEYYLQRYYG